MLYYVNNKSKCLRSYTYIPQRRDVYYCKLIVTYYILLIKSEKICFFRVINYPYSQVL